MRRAAEYLRRNSYIFIIALVLFVIGVCIGALGASGISAEDEIKRAEYANNFFGNTQKVAHYEVFKQCAADNFKLVFMCGLCAMFVYTMPFCFAAIAFKGFTTGFAAGFVLKSFGYKGAIFIFSSFVPSLAFLIPVMFLLCSVCVRFAFMCYKSRSKRKKELASFAASLFALWAAMSLIELTDSFVSEFIVRGIF